MIVYVLLSLGAMLLSVPLFIVFGIGSAAIALDVLGLPAHSLMQVSFDAMTKQVLVAIPIFIFAGAVMLHGGAARRLVDFGMACVGHLPGGMAVALILAIGVVSAISGSILASIVAVGTVMMPPMIRPSSGYSGVSEARAGEAFWAIWQAERQQRRAAVIAAAARCRETRACGRWLRMGVPLGNDAAAPVVSEY